MPVPTTGVVATFGFLLALGFGEAARVLPREARAGVLVAFGLIGVADGDALGELTAVGSSDAGVLGGALGTAPVAATDPVGLLARWTPPTAPPTASATPSATLAVRPTGDLNTRTRGCFSVTDLSFPLTT